MEIKNLLPAIVALLIVASLVSLSTTSVSAQTSSTIDKTLVKASTSTTFTVTVTNNGSTAIDNVRIIVENGSGFAPLMTAPMDNIENCASDNIVVLPAGSVVQLLENENIVLPEGTPVWIDNSKFVYVDSTFDNTKLKENAAAEVRENTAAENIPSLDNISVTQGENVNLNIDNRLRLLKDTSVILVSGTDNIVMLPENASVQVYKQNDNSQISVWENVETSRDLTVTLKDNRVMISDKPMNTKNYDLTGENAQLYDNQVIVLAGTTVQLGRTVKVRIVENENAIRASGENLKVDMTTVENQPLNWMQNWTKTTGTIIDPLNPAIPAVEWDAIGDNSIPAGGNLSFPFALTTPSTTEDSTIVHIWVETPTSIDNSVIITVDGKKPTVSVTASPLYVGENTPVTITVKASETLAMLDNVMVEENNASENTQVTMTSSDKVTWTGTYTTVDNWRQDGTAKIYVVGAQYQDLAGNTGTENDAGTFTVDRENPPAPQLSTITGLPGKVTNVGTWLIKGTALDNFLNTIENLANGTVAIRVGTTTYNAPTNSAGFFYQTITLNQGTQQVGISYIDRAGNKGLENYENVLFDNIAPVITPGTISSKPLGVASTLTLENGVIINDNAPTWTLSIADPTMGIENAAFDNNDNSGYSVQLRNENGVKIGTDNLVNATPPTENMPNTINFENTYPTALADGTYQIYVVAGDNLQMDNLVVTFVIDTTPPDAPTLTSQASLVATNPTTPTSATIPIGGKAEPGATIRVWTSTSADSFATETNVENVVAGSDGKWTASITISQGVIVLIQVDQVDTAGNESVSMTPYGYLRVDVSAPVVTITSPATGTKTDKSTIAVSGIVTKDAWETYNTDVILSLQNGVSSTSIVIPIQSDGTFSVNVTLSEGNNSIIATARDASNNSTSYTVVVDRTVTSWAIYAIILVIIALILAAIAIFRMR